MRALPQERRTTPLIRWPVVVAVLGVVAAELAFYLVLRWILWVAEKIFVTPGKRKRLASLREANSYEEWRSLAMDIDRIDKKQEWKEIERSDFYDCEMLRRNLQQQKSA
eukprot:Opistho-2@4353